MKTSTTAFLEVDEENVEIAYDAHEKRIKPVRLSNRSRSTGAQEVRYRMRCPRCALGLVEIVRGSQSREQCTSCNSIWYEPAELVKIAKNDRTGFFQLFD